MAQSPLRRPRGIVGRFGFDFYTLCNLKMEPSTNIEVTKEKQQLDLYKRRCELLQDQQRFMREPERTIVCDILANGSLSPDPRGTRYGDRPPQGEPRKRSFWGDLGSMLACIGLDMFFFVIMIGASYTFLHEGLGMAPYPSRGGVVALVAILAILRQGVVTLVANLAVLSRMRFND